jgi:outer membrane protein assembly factor BamA
VRAVTVVADVTPGPAVTLGRVRFAGNERTRESVLRPLVPAKEGAPLNPVETENGQFRISHLGVFNAVDLRYEPADGPVRDAVYELTEGKRRDASLLFGYGSYEQLRGGVELSESNLFGRAHQGSLELVQSMKSTRGEYDYTVPELFGSTVDGTAKLYSLRRQERSFLREEYGANLSAAWPVPRLGLDVTTGYTFKRLRNTENSLASSSVDLVDTNAASLNLGLTRDRRDNPLMPRRGYKVSIQVEEASRRLGGQVEYQRLQFGASYHTPLGPSRWLHVGFTHDLVTTLGSLNDSQLPVNERFYPGGDSTIRGYAEGTAAPRAAGGLFLGAKTVMLLNLELEQAVTPKWSVVVFSDSLGMAARMAHYPFDEKLFSVGLGLRYQTVIGPVRLEYGRNLNPRPLDPSGTLSFSIGFPF